MKDKLDGHFSDAWPQHVERTIGRVEALVAGEATVVRGLLALLTLLLNRDAADQALHATTPEYRVAVDNLGQGLLFVSSEMDQLRGQHKAQDMAALLLSPVATEVSLCPSAPITPSMFHCFGRLHSLVQRPSVFDQSMFLHIPFLLPSHGAGLWSCFLLRSARGT
jgi:hypothetical protein